MKNPIKHLYQATIYSLQGFQAVYQHEFAFRIELGLTILVIPTAMLISQTYLQSILLLVSWFLILLIEIINSAFEAVVDRISLERHILSGRAKDLGSAAVFLACVFLAMLWFALAITMKKPAHLSTKIINVGDKIDNQKAAEISESLNNIVGVYEAVIYPKDGTAYLTVDNAILNSEELINYQ